MVDKSLQKFAGTERPCCQPNRPYSLWKAVNICFSCSPPIPQERQESIGRFAQDDKPVVVTAVERDDPRKVAMDDIPIAMRFPCLSFPSKIPIHLLFERSRIIAPKSPTQHGVRWRVALLSGRRCSLGDDPFRGKLGRTNWRSRPAGRHEHVEPAVKRSTARFVNVVMDDLAVHGGLVKKCVSARQAAAFWVGRATGTSTPST